MVVAGEYSLSIYEGTEQEILPQLLVPHPEYNNTTNNNDIMLIKVQYTKHCRSCPSVAESAVACPCSLITLSATSPAEGPRLSEQLRVRRPAAPAGRRRSGGKSVSGVRLGVHQPQHGPDPLHPPHCQAPHRLHRKMQQQRVLRRQRHRKHALCRLQYRGEGRLQGKRSVSAHCVDVPLFEQLHEEIFVLCLIASST